MSQLYVQDILLPDEKILHYAKVHYILYAPGALLMALAILFIYFVPDIMVAVGVDQDTLRSVIKITKFICVSLFMGGIALLLKAWLRIYSTEVVVTNMRVLVKIGVSTATTAEIDRNRVSSVIISKPLLGRIFNYGWVNIMGYSGNITGLPVLSDPHEIQKHIYHSPIANP